MAKVKIIETETYKKSLRKLGDRKVVQMIEKKVSKLLNNPSLARPMGKQHDGICEIIVTGKYRVYCIKIRKDIILFVMGMAINHNKNYKKEKEYLRIFDTLRMIKEDPEVKKQIKDLN